MHIYATLKSDEQHVGWEDGKNGNERPMFCDVMLQMVMEIVHLYSCLITTFPVTFSQIL